MSLALMRNANGLFFCIADELRCAHPLIIKWGVNSGFGMYLIRARVRNSKN